MFWFSIRSTRFRVSDSGGLPTYWAKCFSLPRLPGSTADAKPDHHRHDMLTVGRRYRIVPLNSRNVNIQRHTFFPPYSKKTSVWVLSHRAQARAQFSADRTYAWGHLFEEAYSNYIYICNQPPPIALNQSPERPRCDEKRSPACNEEQE